MHIKFQKKIKNHLLSHRANVKISNFYDLKLCIKNKFIDQIKNNIQFEQNLICMLNIYIYIYITILNVFYFYL